MHGTTEKERRKKKMRKNSERFFKSKSGKVKRKGFDWNGTVVYDARFEYEMCYNDKTFDALFLALSSIGISLKIFSHAL